MKEKIIFGFHAVQVRLRIAPQSIKEIYIDNTRKDARMRSFQEKAKEANVRFLASDATRLRQLSGGGIHQGIVALVDELSQPRSLDDYLDTLQSAPLLLLLDGVTDPHNLGAALRVADGAGVHALIAPKDRACGINATVAHVACGAADTVPYFVVTNLVRTLRELQERGILICGLTGDAEKSIYTVDMHGPLAMVLGAEGAGMRHLTQETCDVLARIPMQGKLESLNVSTACAVALFEARRQRLLFN